MYLLHANLFMGLIGLVFVLSCSKEGKDNVAEKVIAMERAALDRWGKGDPWGFTEISADEVTYFDTGTERRVDGLKALREHYAPWEGKIKIERYEMINPKVQMHGNTAVLSFNLIDYVPTSEGSTREVNWSSTEVYSWINGEWKIIHTHWSKPKLQE
jgi:ketosteroid isomerase-like protein